MQKSTKLLTAAAVVVTALIVLTFLFPEMLPGIPSQLKPLVIWETAYFHVGNVAVTPELLTETLLFLFLLTFATRFSRRFLTREVLVHTSLDEGQRYAIERTAGYAIYALGLLVGLQIIGLNLSSLAFLGGALGIGVGFGLQNIASNFASGLILLMERPIKVGDRIDVGNLNGDVIRIGGRSTWVRTNDNLIIIVPNAEFTTNRVTNWTANDRQVRFSFPIGVAYGSDLELVRSLILKVARQHGDVLHEPPPDVLLSSFGDSSINLELWVWTVTQVQTPSRLKSDIYFEVVRQFAAHGIEIPFPQCDVHLKPEPPSAPPGPAGEAGETVTPL
jgi:small-conductance mechanosensitive channel